LIGNALTLAMQLTLTSRVIRYFGVTLSLVMLPVLSVLGFALLAVWPGLAVLVGFAVLRRAANFAIARPTREILFSVLNLEDKYKAKSFIDTVIFRLCDQVGAWSYAGFESIQLSSSGMAWVAGFLSLARLGSSYWLGRRQEAMVASPK
jgi:AAA family ATP:ADP antiporter